MLKVRVLPASMLAGRVQPGGEERDGWRFLRRPALLGFVALCAITVGASLPSSPFKLEMAGTWFFGEPPPGGSSESFMLFGLVAVYGGLVLLIRVWYGLLKALARRPGVPVRYLGWILVLWVLPMLVVAPIFSRDVYSYAAQGEMMSRHINPYDYGPYTLGAGPYVNPVDPLWLNTPAPYGPLFLLMDGLFASVSFHHVLATVVLLRLSALAGVALIAACIPALSRSFGRDHGPVYVMAVLNPLVVLMLVGAAHNDALMLGLMVAGVTAARYRHPAWGVLLCALAAAIKVPAAIGIVYIGWGWTGPDLPLRERVRPLLKAGAIASAVVLGLSFASGLGIGWIANLDTPGTVRSWLAPATGVGMLLSGAIHAVGLTSVPMAAVLSGTRVLGLGAFGEAPKRGAREAVAALRAQGRRVVLLTGDNAGSAAAAARAVGIDEVIAGQLPEGKAATVAALRREGRVVAMVGDGVNDAPALAAADIGMAMASGSDVAMHTAGITLMRGDPALVAAALDVARATMRKIRQGLFWAFAYNVIGIPLAAIGFLSPMVAGAAMAASSVSVVTNALLLLRWMPPVK